MLAATRNCSYWRCEEEPAHTGGRWISASPDVVGKASRTRHEAPGGRRRLLPDIGLTLRSHVDVGGASRQPRMDRQDPRTPVPQTARPLRISPADGVSPCPAFIRKRSPDYKRRLASEDIQGRQRSGPPSIAASLRRCLAAAVPTRPSGQPRTWKHQQRRPATAKQVRYLLQQAAPAEQAPGSAASNNRTPSLQRECAGSRWFVQFKQPPV